MQATDHYINRKLFCRTNSKVVHLFSNCLFGILSIEQIGLHNLVGWIYRIGQCGTKVNSESHAHETHVSENKTSILDIRLKGWNVRWPRRYFLDTDRATDQTDEQTDRLPDRCFRIFATHAVTETKTSDEDTQDNHALQKLQGGPKKWGQALTAIIL